MASRTGPPQHLGNRGTCGLLEVCRATASYRRGPRVVSSQGFELVSSAAGFRRGRFPIGRRAARPDASVIAGHDCRSIRERTAPNPKEKQNEQLCARVRCCGPRRLSCGADPAIKEVVGWVLTRFATVQENGFNSEEYWKRVRIFR